MLLLQEGCITTSPRNSNSENRPSRRPLRLRRLPAAVNPNHPTPGIASHKAYSGRCHPECTVVTGCGVVWMLKTVEALLLFMVSELLAKLEVAPEGSELLVSETGAENTGLGFSCTVYLAIWPAGIVWLDGLTAMKKLDASKAAELVMFVVVLFTFTTVMFAA